jgi:large repetitive protein
MRRLSALLLTAVVALLAWSAAPAAAATPTWNCEASPLHARLLGIDLTLGLLTSNGNASRCQNDARGLGVLTGGLPIGLQAGVLSSSTTLTGAAGATSGQTASASSSVAGVNLSVANLANLLRVDAATARASARCASGAPSLTGSSTVGNVYLGGVRVIGLDTPVTIVGNVVNGLPTGAVARIVPNEQTIANGVLTQNALHVTVTLLGITVLDTTVGQAIVSSSGAVCDTVAEQRPTVAVVDSGRNRVVAATVTPPAGRTITSCSVTAQTTPATTVTGSYDASTGRCTATLPRDSVPPGSYPITVTATDSAGQTGTGTGTVTVAAPSVGSPAVNGRTVSAPVAPTAGTTVTSCAFAVTAGGNTTNIDGTYDASTGVCRATVPDSVPQGTATVTARATDSGGDTGTATATTTVGAVPPGPAVALVDSGTNRTVTASVLPGTGRTVTACTIGVRPAGSTNTYTSLAARLSSDGTTCTATLPRGTYDPGAYEVRATATDDANRTGSATGTTTVGAPAVGAPTADDHALTATLAPAAGTPVTSCSFTLSPVGGGSDTRVDGTVSPGGTSCSGTAPDSVGAGTYAVTGSARDANGDTGTASAELQIGRPAPPPTPPTVRLTDSGRNRVVTADVAPSEGDTITACSIAVRPADDPSADLVPLDATYDAQRGTCSATLAPGTFDPDDYSVVAGATDSSGDHSSDTGTVRVVAPKVGDVAADGRTITATVDPAPGTPLLSCRIAVTPSGGGGPVTIAGTLTDDTCTATLPDDAIDPGVGTAEVTVTDANGDVGTTSDQVTIGAVPRPAVQLVPSGDNRVVTADVTPAPGRRITSCAIGVRPAGSSDTYTSVDASYDADAGTCTATLPRDTFPVGAYDVRATATDDAGRTGTAEGSAAVAAPSVGTPQLSGRTVTVTATPAPGTRLASCAFTLTPSGGGSGTDVDGTLDAATGTCRGALPDGVAEGGYDVTATVTDDGGDTGTASGTGTVGAVPAGPAVALGDSGQNRTVVATVTPGADPDVTACTLAARPAGSSDAYTSLDADLDTSAGTCTAKLPRDTFPAGPYEVRAGATDASNRTGSASGMVSVAAPVVGSPTADEREVSAPVTPAPGAGIGACDVTLTADGGGQPQQLDGRYDPATSSCVLTVPATIADGVYTATVTATDTAGDSGSSTGEIRVGRPPVAATPPSVSLVDSGRNRVVEARATAPDGESITACVLRARDDGGTLVTLDASYDAAAGTCTATLPTAQFGAGDHDVTALVTDSTGDTADASGTVTVAAPDVGTPVVDGRDVDTPVTPAPGTAVTSCVVTVAPRTAGASPTTLTGTIAADGTCSATLPDSVPAGDADVTVRVTDGNGDTAGGGGTVTVPAPVSGTGGGGSDTPGGGSGGSGGSGSSGSSGSSGGSDTTNNGGGGSTSGAGSPGSTTPGGVSGQAGGAVFATGSANDILLACSSKPILLTDVVVSGRSVRIAGVAAGRYAGRTVTLRFTATGRKVATARIAADGHFTARAKLPSKRLRTSDRARYQAVLGTVKSAALKLTRRAMVTRVAKAGTTVVLRGRIGTPRARKAAPVVVQQLVSCGRYTTAGTVKKLTRSGAFTARVKAPAGVKAVLYRVMTKVATHAGGRASNRTYSLLSGLNLG